MTALLLLQSVAAAIRQILSPPLRRLLWRSLGLTLILLVGLWLAVTQGLGLLLKAHPLSLDHPIVNGFVYFLAGAGLFVAFAYVLPAVSAIVAGFFLDAAAGIVERTDFPRDPPGRELSLGRSLLAGLRFAGLSLVLNLAALSLFFVPVVNIVAFFAANAYLFGREYFEMAAGRFRSPREAADLRREHRATVLAGGAVMAALVLIPVVNLATPLFGIALMVHLHKRLGARGGRSGAIQDANPRRRA